MQGVQLQDVRLLQRLSMTGQNPTMFGTGMGDGFDAIFMNMMASLQDGDALTGILDFNNDTEQDGFAEQDMDLMAELAASLLTQSPQFFDFIQLTDQQAVAQVSQLEISENAKQMLLNFRSTALGEGKKANAMLEQNFSLSEVVSGTEQSKEQSSNPSSNPMIVQVVQQKEESLSDLQNQYMRTIQEVKNRIGSHTEVDETFELDIDQLQMDVAANRFNPIGTVEGKAEQIAAQPEIADQIKTGVAENLLQGKQEFIIKLKPEGLGEITVKLAEDSDGNTTLHLLTASAKTAELIGREAAVLQEAMRPLQVQVGTIQTMESQQANNQMNNEANQQQMMQQFNMFQQHHGGQQQMNYQPGENAFYEDDSFFQAEVSESIETLEGLDTYI